MKLKLFTPLLLALTLATLQGCKKKCKDPSSETNGKREECVYRYLKDVVVNSFPQIRPDGSGWDSTAINPCTSSNQDCKPDLWIKLFGTGSNQINDASGGNITFTFLTNSPYDPMFQNQTYELELLDYDDISNHEVLGTVTFNPLTDGSNGTINATGTNGVSITIHYHN